MWVVYRKSDQKVVGMSAHSEVELDKQFALEEVVKGLVNSGPPSDFDAIQVTDRAQAIAFMTARPDHLVLEKGPGGNLQLSIVEPKISSLALSSDAPDVHPVDGVPEIPADGKAFATITVQKVDERWQPQADRTDIDLLYLRTDYGTLRSADGAEEISSIKLKKGQAAFRLVSEKAKRVATVQVFNADPNLRDRSIRIEFI
jgi:hypothetical protein